METVTEYLSFLEARGVALGHGLTLSQVQGERGITLTGAATEDATLAKIPVVKQNKTAQSLFAPKLISCQTVFVHIKSGLNKQDLCLCVSARPCC